ncbi:MAG: hypothetical protein MUC91_06215 [Verrucomicrobia bacterium]|nr:hypothetical protein [Verrucomicrobiota bacterium]
MKEVKVLHGAENPRDVLLLFEAADLGKAKAFAASDDLRIKMKEFGVVTTPDVIFLTD